MMNEKCDKEAFYHYCKEMIKYKKDIKRSNSFVNTYHSGHNAPTRYFTEPTNPDPLNCPDISDLSEVEIKSIYKISDNEDYEDFVDFSDNYYNLIKPNLSITTTKTTRDYGVIKEKLEKERNEIIKEIKKTQDNNSGYYPTPREKKLYESLNEVERELKQNEENKSTNTIYKRGGNRSKRRKSSKRKSSKRKSLKRMNTKKYRK